MSVDKPECVLYWMSNALRVTDNPALYQAQQAAIRAELPLLCLFIVNPKFPAANTRNMSFLLDSLPELQENLSSKNIAFMIKTGNAVNCIEEMCEEYELKHVISEISPFLWVQDLQKAVNANLQKRNLRLYLYTTATIVPLHIASEKLEFSARTIRPKLNRRLEEFLTIETSIITHPTDMPPVEKLTIEKMGVLLDSLELPIIQKTEFVPGESEALRLLENFANRIAYVEYRNIIEGQGQSYLSPYLHYGMISPITIIKRIQKCEHRMKDIFIEECFIRRELAYNYVYYQPEYTNINGAWSWAKETLRLHQSDKRSILYSDEELELAKTHDEVWNYCQRTLVEKGYLHSYLRMYWAKQVLLWKEDPQEAIDFLVNNNDKYFLDGRDPNGYTGIMWSVAGVHDRPWPSAEVVGSVRRMSAHGTIKKTGLRL